MRAKFWGIVAVVIVVCLAAGAGYIHHAGYEDGLKGKTVTVVEHATSTTVSLPKASHGISVEVVTTIYSDGENYYAVVITGTTAKKIPWRVDTNKKRGYAQGSTKRGEIVTASIPYGGEASTTLIAVAGGSGRTVGFVINETKPTRQDKS